MHSQRIYILSYRFHNAGFVGALIALSRGELGRGGEDQPIYLDQVTCLGDETALSQCHHNQFGLHDCSHYEDAGMICQGKFKHSFLLLPNPPPPNKKDEEEKL